MEVMEAAANVAPARVAAAVYPEPEWVRRAADDLGYRWVRVHWQRASVVSGAWYDSKKADAVVALWPRVFRLTVDRFAQKPFVLRDWQEPIVRLLVGWKRPSIVDDVEQGRPVTLHVRLFRQLRLWIPRKNGKSEFLAALALLFFLLEGVVAGEGYVFARDEEQAKIPFDRMKAMVAYSPLLAKRVLATKKSIWVSDLRAAFLLLSGKGEGKHGKSPTVILGDEMHEWETLDVMNNLRQGTGARLQPIELYASTAGLKTQAVGLELWEESLAIYEGRIDDPTTLVVVFAAAADDDWSDEKTIAKANPSLGLSPTHDFIRRELAFAKDSSRAEANFRRYHLNQWVEQLVRWLDAKKWADCTGSPDGWKRYANELRGRKCFATADVSETFDFSSLTFWFPPIEGEAAPKIVQRFWLPQATIEKRTRMERVGFDHWAAAGAITSIPGEVIDQNYVLNALLEGFALYDVQMFGYDKWNAAKLFTDLVAAGVEETRCTAMRMGHQTLGEATKDFERRVYAGALDHGGHPVLAWMAGHACVRFDENMNIVPAKKRSQTSIDGIVTLVMADALAMVGGEKPKDYQMLFV